MARLKDLSLVVFLNVRHAIFRRFPGIEMPQRIDAAEQPGRRVQSRQENRGLVPTERSLRADRGRRTLGRNRSSGGCKMLAQMKMGDVQPERLRRESPQKITSED